MKERDIEQFEGIISLYAEVNQHHNEFFIGRFNDLGYISIQYISREGRIEQATLHRTPKELYHFLEERWEGDWLYDYARKQGIRVKDYDDYAEHLPEDIKKTIAEMHRQFKKQAKELLKTE